jgi:hypothetical protein
MPADKFFQNEQACRAYVEQEENVSMVASRDRGRTLEILSQYLPDKDKVHVALGVGGGLDFKLLQKIPCIVRRIGVDYSPHMLDLCRERHSHAELLKDDLRSLRELKEILKDDGRPVIYTLLSNTLGNFETSEIRKGVVKTVRGLMKEDDLFVAELYKRPELLVTDPGLIPDFFLKTKVRVVDFERKQLSEPIPLIKVPVMKSFINPEYAWVLHSLDQQQHYSELKCVQVAVGDFGHSAYNPETGDMVVYRKEAGKDFEPVFVSHRWEGMELASTFLGADLLGDTINGEDSFITFLVPYGGENFEEFERHYDSLFY